MNSIYTSITIIGAVLITVIFVLILIERKKTGDYIKRLDIKKEELVEIITDAEQMVDELNKFSDYIVTQMDVKNQELFSNLKIIDEKLKNISIGIREDIGICEDKVIRENKVFNNISEVLPIAVNEGLQHQVLKGVENPGVELEHDAVIDKRPDEIVIPISKRYAEVLNLAEKGMSEIEIAKKLNMGKGEVQLILGVRK